MKTGVEIVIEGQPDDLLRTMTCALDAAGWRIGRTDRTPHRGSVRLHQRERALGYQLGGVSEAAAFHIARRLAGAHTGRVAFVGKELHQWRAGGKLPDEAAEAERVCAATRADELFGATLSDRPCALVEFYRPYDDSLADALEGLFQAIRERLAAGRAVEVPGLATFEADGEGGVAAAIRARPSEALRARLRNGRAVPIDLRWVMPAASASERGLVQGALSRAIDLVSNGGCDVLVGAGLALTPTEPLLVGW